MLRRVVRAVTRRRADSMRAVRGADRADMIKRDTLHDVGDLTLGEFSGLSAGGYLQSK